MLSLGVARRGWSPLSGLRAAGTAVSRGTERTRRSAQPGRFSVRCGIAQALLAVIRPGCIFAEAARRSWTVVYTGMYTTVHVVPAPANSGLRGIVSGGLR